MKIRLSRGLEVHFPTKKRFLGCARLHERHGNGRDGVFCLGHFDFRVFFLLYRMSMSHHLWDLV